jgi:hypothetical protein
LDLKDNSDLFEFVLGDKNIDSDTFSTSTKMSNYNSLEKTAWKNVIPYSYPKNESDIAPVFKSYLGDFQILNGGIVFDEKTITPYFGIYAFLNYAINTDELGYSSYTGDGTRENSVDLWAKNFSRKNDFTANLNIFHINPYFQYYLNAFEFDTEPKISFWKISLIWFVAAMFLFCTVFIIYCRRDIK